MEERMDRMDVSSWLHSRGKGRHAEGVCDALAAHGLPSGEWRQTLEAMPTKYFEDFIEALEEAAADGGTADGAPAAAHETAPAPAPATSAQPEPEPEPEVPIDAAHAHDPAYAELLRECSRALSPTPELSRQSSDVIAELERMVSTPLSPAEAPYKSAGPFSPERAADSGVASSSVTDGSSEQASASIAAQGQPQSSESAELVAAPAAAATATSAKIPPAASATEDPYAGNTLRMMPSTPSQRPKRSLAAAPDQAPSAAASPPGPAVPPSRHKGGFGSGDIDSSAAEADPTPVLTQLRAKAAAAAAAAASTDGSTAAGVDSGSNSLAQAPAPAPSRDSPAPPPLSSTRDKVGANTKSAGSTTSASSSDTGSFGREGDSSDSSKSESRDDDDDDDAVAAASGVADQRVADPVGSAIGDVDLASLIDHFRTDDEVPQWLLKELEQSLLQTGTSQQSSPARERPSLQHRGGHNNISVAAAATVEEQQKIEALLAAPLLPVPDRDPLSPSTSPTLHPDEPDRRDGPGAADGAPANDITRPTCSWAQQHPIAMAVAATKPTREGGGMPRRVTARRLPHPRTPDASREASHDPGAWLTRASYAIHGRWLVVDTFYEWKLWMRRLGQQRARTSGLRGLSPPPPGVSWRLRRQRYQMLQATSEAQRIGTARGVQSRALSPEDRSKLAAQAAAAANEHLVKARKRRERRLRQTQSLQQTQTDSPNGDDGCYDLSDYLPVDDPQARQPPSVSSASTSTSAVSTDAAERKGVEVNSSRISSADARRGFKAMDMWSTVTSETNPRHDLQPQQASQSRPLSWAVAELEHGLVALQRLLKPHAELLLNEDNANAELHGVIDSNDGGKLTDKAHDAETQAPVVIQAAIASTEAFADSVVEAAAATTSTISHSQPRQEDWEQIEREGLLAKAGDSVLALGTDPDSLIEHGPPATNIRQNGFRNGRSSQQQRSTGHIDHAYVHPSALSPPAHQNTQALTSPVRFDQSRSELHGRWRTVPPAGNAATPDHLYRGSVNNYGRGRCSDNTPSSHGRRRSLSPPASPIYAVKQEYEVVDPPCFLDLSPRQRPRNKRYDAGRGRASAERAGVRTSGKRQRRP